MPSLFLPLLDNGLGSARLEFLSSFIKSFSGREMVVTRISDSHPGRGRNRAAANFLATDCDYMLFIDSDIVFTPLDIERLMESNEPIAAGIYFLKSEEVKPCLQTLPGHQPFAVGGMLEVARTGTGFLRIHRSVFEKLKEIAKPYTNHGRPEWDFFCSGVVGNEWLSEDWYFCDMARAAGFKVMVDTRIQLGHEGSIVYPIKRTPDRLTVCHPDMKFHLERIWKGEYNIELDPPPATALDVGGNVGGFSVWASEKWPGVSIEAYEPHPENCALFRINTRHFPRVMLHEAAVRAEEGISQLVEGTNAGEHSFKMEGGKSLPAWCDSAASLPSFEFVKLDCEGCELEILQRLDLSSTRAVALEYHTAQDAVDITALLADKGFTQLSHEVVADGRGLLKFKR